MTTKTIPEHHYSVDTPVGEPVEIRLVRRSTPGGVAYDVRVLTAWRTGHGTIAGSLTKSGVGIPESLSNLQSKVPFPGKAIAGWQAEVIAFAAAGHGEITEIR
jgi:hypothetical protein